MPGREIAALLGMLGAVFVILALAWVFTRYVAARGLQAGRFSGGRDGKIELVEKLPLGRDQFLVLARTGESFLLLGVTQGSITLLRSFTKEEAENWKNANNMNPPIQNGGTMPFREALKQVLNQRRK
jgi:flagellar protein FliO/FliZ